MNVAIVTALIAAWVPILGLFITNALERRRALRLRELEFRLDRYKEFLQALCEFGVNRTYATQLRFANSLIRLGYATQVQGSYAATLAGRQIDAVMQGRL